MKIIPTTGWGKVFGTIGTILAVLVILSVVHSNKTTTLSASPVPTAGDLASISDKSQPSTKASQTPEHTVRFVVIGSPSDVTYGHGGSTSHGTAPMRLTIPLDDHATDYSLTAVLGDGGHVTVKILIDGKVMGKATADGQYQSAMVVVAKNPFTGQWENALGA